MKYPLEVCGDVVEAMIGFQQPNTDGPEMMVLHLRPSGWWYVFVEYRHAWFEELNEESRHDMFQSTYAGFPNVDYGARLGLIGAAILRAELFVGLDPEYDLDGITIELDRGTLTLRLVDPSDFDSDTRLEWTPRR